MDPVKALAEDLEIAILAESTQVITARWLMSVAQSLFELGWQKADVPAE